MMGYFAWPFVLVFLVSANAYATGNSKVAEQIRADMTTRGLTPQINIAKDLTILDHWFFSGPKEKLVEASKIRSDANEIKTNQVFGIGIVCSSSRKSVKMKIVLNVPSKPDNFRFKVGTVSISMDKKTVTAEFQTSCLGEGNEYYWGIGSDDPTGDYEIKLSIEGQLVEIHRFKVIK